jgi:3-phenylpropionate/trans-cinnamate dioxygenase ferredoxin reductase component
VSEPQRIVIAGAGLAGAKAAEGLREEGFEGSIELIGAEAEAPYERPPLSKDYLRGESEREGALVHPDGYYRGAGISLRTDERVESIDPAAHRVVLSGGEEIPYDRLLLATGARPRKLRIPGSDLDGIHYLRRLGDSDSLRERLAGIGRLAIVGGGWIGAEVAASARTLGVEVVVLERGRVMLGAVLGDRLGEMFESLHTEHGVEIRRGVAVEGFEGGAHVEGVRLAGGETIACDAALVAVGAIPEDALASDAGIEVDGGVLVDEHLETSAPGVFAAGDVANAWRPFYARRLRVEHWANAIEHGRVAARTMLGMGPGEEVLPYFFSDQYDLGMEYTGHAGKGDELVVRGDFAGRELIAFWLSAGRVVAGMNVNVWDVAEEIGTLIRSRAIVDPARLADDDVPLSELAPAVAG